MTRRFAHNLLRLRLFDKTRTGQIVQDGEYNQKKICQKTNECKDTFEKS